MLARTTCQPELKVLLLREKGRVDIGNNDVSGGHAGCVGSGQIINNLKLNILNI